MADEVKIGSSSGFHEGMTCSEFDALLADAIDDALKGDVLDRFEQHAAACYNCGPLLAETRQGLAWLKTLEEVEPPANLVHNILAFTSRADSRASAASFTRVRKKEKESWSFASLLQPWRLLRTPSQPGFVGTLGMAFFSLSLLLNVAGFNLRTVANLRPSTVRKQVVLQYYATSARVVRYYQNTRLVYEVESKLRELRRAAGASESEEPAPKNAPIPDKTLNQQQPPSPALEDGSADGLALGEQDWYPYHGNTTDASLSLRCEKEKIVRRLV